MQPVPLLIALRLQGRPALVVGGGEIGLHRVRTLLASGAVVRVVTRQARPELHALARDGRIELELRDFDPDDPVGMAIALTAIDDAETSRRIAQRCRELGVLINAADRPELCDLFFPALHRDGPLQVAVSTSGFGPGMAARIRDIVASALPDSTREALERFSALRGAIRRAEPAEGASETRMGWLRRFLQATDIDQLARLSDGDIDQHVRRFRSDLPIHPEPETPREE